MFVSCCGPVPDRPLGVFVPGPWLSGPVIPSGGENLFPRVPPPPSQLIAQGVGRASSPWP